jgi:hypothetical protein
VYEPFFDFAEERHRIYLRRVEQGLPAPWTKDPILHKFRFTNVYRELDNVTVWFRENVRDKYDAVGREVVTLATVVFRLFNRNLTGEAIFKTQTLSGETPFEQFLRTGDAMSMRPSIVAHCGRGPYCTGAYIINSPNGMDKLTGVLTMIQWVYDRRHEFLEEIQRVGTLEHAWEQFRKVNHIADFTSYELVTDLRYTNLLRNAPDIETWANPGPGAMRGLNRLHGRPIDKNQRKHLFVCEMRDVLREAHEGSWPAYWPRWEMREVEHTLCEYDKYLRTKNGEGRPRGVYPHGASR